MGCGASKSLAGVDGGGVSKPSRRPDREARLSAKTRRSIDALTGFLPGEAGLLSAATQRYGVADGERRGGLGLQGFARAFGAENNVFTPLLFRFFDYDKSGSIGYREFVLGLAAVHSTSSEKFVFRLFDQADKATVPADDLALQFKQMQRSCQGRPQLADLADKLQRIGVDLAGLGGSSIMLDDFKALMTRHPRVFQQAHKLREQVGTYSATASQVIAKLARSGNMQAFIMGLNAQGSGGAHAGEGVDAFVPGQGRRGMGASGRYVPSVSGGGSSPDGGAIGGQGSPFGLGTAKGTGQPPTPGGRARQQRRSRRGSMLVKGDGPGQGDGGGGDFHNPSVTRERAHTVGAFPAPAPPAGPGQAPTVEVAARRRSRRMSLPGNLGADDAARAAEEAARQAGGAGRQRRTSYSFSMGSSAAADMHSAAAEATAAMRAPRAPRSVVSGSGTPVAGVAPSTPFTPGGGAGAGNKPQHFTRSRSASAARRSRRASYSL